MINGMMTCAGFEKQERIRMGNDQTLKCIEQAQKGDKEALETLIHLYYGLVVNIALKYAYAGFDFHDLFQEGMVGFIKSVYWFNADLGYRLSTYATHCIRTSIQQYINNGTLIRIPRQKDSALHYELRKEMERNIKSLDAEIKCEGKCVIRVMETIEDKRFDFNAITDLIVLEDELLKLDHTTQMVFFYRFTEGMTQKETAEKMGVSQPQVCRIEKKTFKRLRNALELN